jgi:hypothetical protein
MTAEEWRMARPWSFEVLKVTQRSRKGHAKVTQRSRKKRCASFDPLFSGQSSARRGGNNLNTTIESNYVCRMSL